MKKLIFVALFGVALFATSCDKEGGKCVCTYKVGNLELKDQEISLEGTDLTCAEYEESLTKEGKSEVNCKPAN